jgi:hypothetical protein
VDPYSISQEFAVELFFEDLYTGGILELVERVQTSHHQQELPVVPHDLLQELQLLMGWVMSRVDDTGRWRGKRSGEGD